MRAAVVLLVVLGACTPDIVSGAYLCGPDASCPDGQVCNGPDNICVLPLLAKPFACEPSIESEPDNTAAEAQVISDLGCVSVPFVADSCMLDGDTADWVKFAAPSVCAAVKVNAGVAFPFAFERLGLELWDLDRDMTIATDEACPESADFGEQRCLEISLVPGTNYGIKVSPAGDGNCDGGCAYNRYTLRVQLETP